MKDAIINVVCFAFLWLALVAAIAVGGFVAMISYFLLWFKMVGFFHE